MDAAAQPNKGCWIAFFIEVCKGYFDHVLEKFGTKTSH